MADRFTLPVAEALVIAEEKRLVVSKGATQRAAKLVLPVFGFGEAVRILKEVGSVQPVVA